MDNITFCILCCADDKHFLERTFHALPKDAHKIICMHSIKDGAVTFEHETDNNFTLCTLTTPKLDFALMRNKMQSVVKTKYVFMLDADEELMVNSHNALNELLKTDFDVAFINNISVIQNNHETLAVGVARIHRANLLYTGTVHEQVTVPPSARTIYTDIVVQHHGYNVAPAQILKKYKRNLLAFCDYGANNMTEAKFAQMVQTAINYDKLLNVC